MLKYLGRWLNVYEEEIALFLWAALLFFLIRSSSLIFNNFAETAFLKRFGVEYLPLVYMVNSISTFVVMAFITGFMARLPGSRLLGYLFLFCGISVAGLRFVIPLGFDLLYPLLYVLKSQYEVLLALIFWNLANDLFNTRQSKRLFPLLSAGGVLGGIAGSFTTPLLARAITMDNLMLAYLGMTVIGAVAIKGMGGRFPTLLLSEKKPRKVKSKAPKLEEFKKMLPLLKKSKLIKILVLLTLLPNVVIPIMNYQFNFAIDQTFATEGKMIEFFAYFNGALNIISLIILLFVGRIYGRWGLPVALMFHPANYLFAFLAFLLRFDWFSAMYARVSTNVLRNTINNPARNVMMGLFPESYRSAIRPFLRGTVVRIGLLMGAGIIMLSEHLVHPRYLSLVAMVFVIGWILSTISLKRSYSKILLDLISNNMLDLKSMEERDMGHVFGDKQIQSQLVNTFAEAEGENCLWFARLLRSLGVEDLDSRILQALEEKDDKTRIGLLPLLSSTSGELALPVFRKLADPQKPELMIALARAAGRLPEETALLFLREIIAQTRDPLVKSYAIAGLYRRDADTYREIITSWLASEDARERKAGVIAAGESGDSVYLDPLQNLLITEQDGATAGLILESLGRLGFPRLNALAEPYLAHPLESVRVAALQACSIEGDDAMRTVITRLADSSDRVHELAKHKLETAVHQNPQLLVESLVIPRRKVREGIFDLLESMNIKDLDVFRFARTQLEQSFATLAEEEALRRFSPSQERELLLEHLQQHRAARMDNILRVLAAQDRSGQLRLIWRGVFSANQRQRSNSLEALDNSLDHSLGRILLPLLEGLSAEQSLAIGKKHFQLPVFDSDRAVLLQKLLSEEDWVTLVLTLNLILKNAFNGFRQETVAGLSESGNQKIAQMARSVLAAQGNRRTKKETTMGTAISIPDKILYLRNIQIFEGLAVGELAAIASVTEEVDFPPGEVVIREGEPGETMYLVVKGEVTVIKELPEEEKAKDIELDRIGAGDYFGEMALFEDRPRSATIRTAEDCCFLVLHKREFAEIVREYPQIALHICKALSDRLLKLHEKLKAAGQC